MTNENVKKCGALLAQYFCSELKLAIKETGHSQRQVAIATGHDPADMSHWLSADPPINLTAASEVCQYIGVSIGEIARCAQARLDSQPTNESDDDLDKNIVERRYRLAAYQDQHKDEEANGEKY